MRNAPDITNVVDACNLEGRQERLEGMLSQLEICEKALQVICHSALCHEGYSRMIPHRICSLRIPV